MNNIDPPLLIFGGIAVAVILIIAGYFIVRSMKGSLKLELSQKSVISGEKILGMLSVVTKKKIGESMDDGLGKSVVKGLGAVGSMTNMGGRKRWKVKARLEMKGVDLADSSKIHVSLKQT